MKHSFISINRAAWLEKIKVDLKGKSLQEFDWHVNEAISISPFIHGEDTSSFIDYSIRSVPPIAIKNEWLIVENFHRKLPNEGINKYILEALAQGVQGIQIPYMWVQNVKKAEQVLKDVDLSMISLYITAESTDEIAQYTTKNGNTAPFSNALQNVNGGFEWSKTPDNLQSKNYLQQIVKTPFFTDFSRWNILCISSPKQNQDTSELSDLLIQLTAWAGVVEAEGMDFQTWYERTLLKVNMEDRYFINIAKIRALKILLANWEKMYFSKEVKTPRLRAEIVSQSRGEDANIELIPTTWKVMSAVLGGVHEINIHTDDTLDAYHKIRRNIQHLVRDESKLDLVIDPAAGSYWLEELTAQLARQTWKEFHDKLEAIQK